MIFLLPISSPFLFGYFQSLFIQTSLENFLNEEINYNWKTNKIKDEKATIELAKIFA